MEDDGDTDSISLTSTAEETWDEDEEFQVESILAEKEVKGQKLYLVKWEGYSHTDNTWEPERSFQNDIPLENWRARKLLEEEGSYKPFDLDEWAKAKQQKVTQREERRRRRDVKRAKINGVPVNHFSRKSTGFREGSRPKYMSCSEGSDREDNNASRNGFTRQSITGGSSQQRLRRQYPRKLVLSSSSGEDKEESPHQPPRKVRNSTLVGPDSLNVSRTRLNPKKKYKETLMSDASSAMKSNFGGLSPGNGKTFESQNTDKSALEDTRIAQDHVSKIPDKAEAQKDNTGEKEVSAKNAESISKVPSIFSRKNVSPSTANDTTVSKKRDLSGKPAASKDGFFKKIRSQRRAELRGRDEPPPDISKVQFLDQNARKFQKNKPASSSLDTTSTSILKVTKGNSVHRGEAYQYGGESGTEIVSEPSRNNEPTIPDPSKQDFTEGRTHSKQTEALSHEASNDNEAQISRIRNKERREQISNNDIEVSTTGRGVSAKEPLRRAVPIPFDALNRNILNPGDENCEKYKVFGHVAVGGIQIAVELACSSMNVKHLLLEVKDKTDVRFPFDHLVTAEEYWGIFHPTGNAYYGAGKVQGRHDKYVQTPREHAANGLQRLRDHMQARHSVALYLGSNFSILIWPSGEPTWSMLDKLFHPDTTSTPLRFLVRTAIRQPFSSDQCVNFQRRHIPTPENARQGAMDLLLDILGIDWRKIISDETYHHLFLLYDTSNSYEHDLLATFARRMGLQVWSSLVTGHWCLFCSKVAGLKGLKDKSVELEKGIVLAHKSFRHYRLLPRLFRLLERGVRVFVIDSHLRKPKSGSTHGEFSTEFDTAHQLDADLRRDVVGCSIDADQWQIKWEHVMPSKTVVTEVFPAKQGHAILLLDSFFVNDPESTYRFLLWYKEKSKEKLEAWRLVVRPDIHDWVGAIIEEQRRKEGSKQQLLIWKNIRHIVGTLIDPESLSEDLEHEVEETVHYPMMLSFHRRTCPGFNIHYPLGDKGKNIDIARQNDAILFEWFGRWSLGELRLFRRFHVLSGERDPKVYENMLNTWSKEWRHVSLSQSDEYLQGNKIFDWYSREHSPEGMQ